LTMTTGGGSPAGLPLVAPMFSALRAAGTSAYGPQVLVPTGCGRWCLRASDGGEGPAALPADAPFVAVLAAGGARVVATFAFAGGGGRRGHVGQDSGGSGGREGRQGEGQKVRRSMSEATNARLWEFSS
jgi:hypothetical protein